MIERYLMYNNKFYTIVKQGLADYLTNSHHFLNNKIYCTS